MSNINKIRSITATFLTTAIFASSSMVALASGQPMGALTVSGNSNEVVINGESAETGRTVFSSNTIVTPADTTAIINLGKLGQVELAPNSSLSLNFSDAGITGTLNSGNVKVSSSTVAKIETKDAVVTSDENANNIFNVSLDGNKTNTTSELGSVSLNNGKTSTKVNSNSSSKRAAISSSTIGIFVGVIAAAAVIIYTAVKDSDDNQTGGSAVVVSPTR
ncbi:MAG: hypothetical protein H7Z37_04675 [Pyrinomonadaceae bacterium]|nr:hypothetical protein [Pyrinomonadaceae bacterium]